MAAPMRAKEEERRERKQTQDFSGKSYLRPFLTRLVDPSRFALVRFAADTGIVSRILLYVLKVYGADLCAVLCGEPAYYNSERARSL